MPDTLFTRRAASAGLLAGAATWCSSDAWALQAAAGSPRTLLQARNRPVTWVDPFIGTDGTGHVTPGAAVPFGMVLPGPDHADRGWSYSSGYQHRAARVLGFSNTHISGAGIPELGDVLLMPCMGRRWRLSTTDFSARVDKASERAQPGYYSVVLPDHGVRVELAAQPRVAVQRYTFASGDTAQLLVDLQHGLHFTDQPRVTAASVQVDAARGEISGTVHSRNWVERQMSFLLRLDRPIGRVQELPRRPGDQAPRLLLDLELGATRMVVVRIAFSTVDADGARRNLADAGRPTFQEVRAAAEQSWAALLGRVQVDADERTRRIFQSALYRTLLHPSDIADADGRVRGPRGQVLQARGGRYYSTLSLWDTFRGVHPLFTLLVPERVPGMMQSLLDHHRQQGYLPLWTAWGRETWTMIGNPALPVLADAMAKGFSSIDQAGGFDAREALEAMVTTASADRPDAPEWAQRTWAVLDRYGYLPFDLEPGESVSKTLEHGIGDDAVARVARMLGRADLARAFGARAQGWRQLFDPTLRVMRGKDSGGRWREPFDPLAATSPMNNPGDYTEANAWQYTASPALHDPEGFRDLLGGPRALGAWLDTLLELPARAADKHLGQEAMIGQLAHGNEPCHHVPWLYAWSDQPWKAPALVRRIANSFYGDGPGGLIGNDDCGQMSAWYVFATLGLYPSVPAGGGYTAGWPMVKAARLTLAGGRTLEIRADAAPSAGQGTSLSLDGRPLPTLAVPHAALAAGGELRFGVRR